MKNIKILFIATLAIISSCINDKGSYNYTSVPRLKIENVQDSYPLVANVDKLTISPKLISPTGDEISSSDPNYEYRYQISASRRVDGVVVYWTDLESDGPNIDQVLHVKEGSYKLWLTVTDKRTGIFADRLVDVVLSMATTEGWMLLGTDNENNTRMDMVTVISPTRIESATNIMSSRGLPEGTKGAYCIGFYPNAGAFTADRMFLMTSDIAYTLNNETFETSENTTINYTDFAKVDELTSPIVSFSFTGLNGGNIAVTAEGHGYAMEAVTSRGPRFLGKINGTAGKLSPFVGYDATRPEPIYSVAVMYDVTNMCFLGWSNSRDVVFPLKNPQNDIKFDFTNKDKTVKRLMYLGPSAFMRRSYAVLENKDGTIDIAAIAIRVANIYTQDLYLTGVEKTATDIRLATQFAFSSEYPVMFYSVGNKVYSYHLETKVCNSISVGGDVTKLKFNRWQNTMQGGGVLNKADNTEFMDQQNQLIICSYDSNKPTNGGTFTLYGIKDDGTLGAPKSSYNGLCRIVDVIYRERRK